MRLLRADFEQPTTSSGFTLPNCMASLQTYSRPHGDVPEVRVLLAFELSDFADRSVDSTALQSLPTPALPPTMMIDRDRRVFCDTGSCWLKSHSAAWPRSCPRR